MTKEGKPERRPIVGANLSVSDRLLETTWGVLIVLSITGSAEVGAGLTGAQVFIIGLVAAFAWAVIEGIMDLLRRRFEFVNNARIIARAADSPETADKELTEALRSSPLQFLNAEDQAQIRRSILEAAARAPAPSPRLTRKDLISSFETASVLWVATLPVLLPFLLLPQGALALAVSQGLAIFTLLGVGAAWGRYSEQNPLYTGLLMAAVGVALAALLQVLNA